MISAVRKSVDTPIILGGGIRTPEQAIEAYEAGADVIVVGNQIESDLDFVSSLSKVKSSVIG